MTAEYGWIFEIQKLGESEKLGEYIMMNLNNVNVCTHMLELKIFSGNWDISQKLQEISKCCHEDLCAEQERKTFIRSEALTMSRMI